MPPLLLKDLAHAAGVSEATVCRALNGTGRVAPTTRARIRALAESLGYQGNFLARGLATGKTNLVGVCGQAVLEPFMEKVIRALASALAAQGLTMILVPLGVKGGISTLLSLEVSALVTCWEDPGEHPLPTTAPPPKLARISGARGVPEVKHLPPLVVIGASSRHYPSFDVDRHLGVLTGVRHLLRLGHRRLLFVGGLEQTSKVAGFRQALEEAGLPFHPDFLLSCGPTALDGYRLTASLLSRQPRPTAVVTSNDEIASGLLQGLRDAGIAVPETISVLGYDGTFVDGTGRAPFATVAQPAAGLAQAVASFLVSKLKNPAVPPAEEVKPTLLAPTLVLADSLGPPPAGTEE